MWKSDPSCSANLLGAVADDAVEHVVDRVERSPGRRPAVPSDVLDAALDHPRHEQRARGAAVLDLLDQVECLSSVVHRWMMPVVTRPDLPCIR
jgi:hypothetical protein